MRTHTAPESDHPISIIKFKVRCRARSVVALETSEFTEDALTTVNVKEMTMTALETSQFTEDVVTTVNVKEMTMAALETSQFTEDVVTTVNVKRCLWLLMHESISRCHYELCYTNGRPAFA